ncbi:EamA family transporter RarD [Tropicibacter sp. R16_0]|uniref:EamA family transporter RarD n=1 Tax=Tropicibacter sp. R16_0 TaxID=2821102 RepID=UPI001ADB9D91|nr:EamA family transporter RarD [Tropicibacter sp. R16_0]MBO9450640.1 EamA family transporter RarD [Tropicibacter sp. R16_0]
MSTPAEPAQNVDTPQGLAFAISAYVLWGFLPLYLKAVSHIPAAEVVAHRVIWSVPLAGVLLIILGRTKDLKVALRTPRMLMMGCVTAALISINWGIYVWAIANDNAIDAALGYYINPLFSIALGALLLGERLNRAQLVAIAFAGAGVIVLIVESGSVPWVALSLTLSWGFYAFFKKSLPIGPNQGFLLEVLILTIPALGYLAYLTSQGASSFGGTWSDTALLMGCGVVTAVPLILYANGAKLLRLSTVGILQYIAPSMIFLNAVFVFGEEIGRGRLIAFPLIWAGLVIYSLSMIRSMRRAA